jgi:MYXO-CTERM domain-containing protein
MRGLRAVVMISMVVAMPAMAQAEAKGAVPMAFVSYETPSQCAFSLKVTDSVGGMTDGTETLKLGASLSYSFSGGSFSPPKLDVGSYVLYASPSISSSLGLKADITIPDADCATFNASGGDISFDGSLGANPDLFKLTIPAGFGTHKAVDGSGTSTDLKAAAILLYGFTGNWSVGTGTAPTNPGDGDEGCAVAGAPGVKAAWPLLLLGAMVAVRRRRRRS